VLSEDERRMSGDRVRRHSTAFLVPALSGQGWGKAGFGGCPGVALILFDDRPGLSVPIAIIIEER
jgi:hypothetical protein